MPDANDIALLRKFVRDNSEAAFTELVRRHINLVYSVARRCTGTDGDAQDVTQAVFIILARKAAGLSEKTLLTGWLYETTRFTAARLLRTNARRRAREQEAYMQSTLNEADTANVWPQLAPHLETAMGKLSERDRALLVLRFYENKSGQEAAALLGIGEDAAHKRAARAIEKLRKIFAKRGVAISATAIAGAVSANSVQAAPMTLVKTISTVAVAKGAAATASTLTLVKGALKIMAWTKMQTTIVAGAVVLLAAGTATVTVKEIHAHNANTFSLTNSQNIVVTYKNSDEQFRQYMTRVNALWKIYNSDAPDSVEKFIQGTHELIKDYPNRPNGYQNLMSVISDYSIQSQTQSRALAQELIDGSAPDEFKQWAKGFLYRMDSMGKPITMKFVAVDGREVNLEQMRGKVVLVLFWAGGFDREFSRVKAAFEKFHAQGFEIIGIYCDTDKNKLQKFIQQQQITWPWYFDDKRTSDVGDKISVEFGIDGWPSMFLVDKEGRLRFDNVRASDDQANFEEKISELLAEQ